MGLGTILIIVLIIALLGGFGGLGGRPFYGTGYYGGGGPRPRADYRYHSGRSWPNLMGISWTVNFGVGLLLPSLWLAWCLRSSIIPAAAS